MNKPWFINKGGYSSNSHNLIVRWYPPNSTGVYWSRVHINGDFMGFHGVFSVWLHVTYPFERWVVVPVKTGETLWPYESPHLWGYNQLTETSHQVESGISWVIRGWFPMALKLPWGKHPFRTGWWFGCHQFYFPINIGWISSSQLTNLYFSEGWLNHQPENHQTELGKQFFVDSHRMKHAGFFHRFHRRVTLKQLASTLTHPSAAKSREATNEAMHLMTQDVILIQVFFLMFFFFWF